MSAEYTQCPDCGDWRLEPWNECSVRCVEMSRYRAAMTAMSRFLVWCFLEARSQQEAQVLDRGVAVIRREFLASAIDRGLFRLEFKP